jgi:hypothetical protein
MDDNFTCIDLNRAGFAFQLKLLPNDLFFSRKAWQYVTQVRKLVKLVEYL